MPNDNGGNSRVIVKGINPATQQPQDVWTDAQGRLQVSSNAQTFLQAPINAAASGDNVIVTNPNAGQKIKVVGYTLVADGTVLAKWRSDASDISGAMSLVANSGVSTYTGRGHLLETAADADLVINLSVAVGVRGHLTYFLEA